MQGVKVIWWLIMVLALVVGLRVPQGAQASGLSLAQDFRIQLKRGITLFFFGGPDEGVCITLRGHTAVFQYLDGTKADGSLQKRVDSGYFSFTNDRITLHGDFLKKDVTLQLKPFLPKYATGNASKARFQLIGPDFPLGGYGPVELPLKTLPLPFVIKKR